MYPQLAYRVTGWLGGDNFQWAWSPDWWEAKAIPQFTGAIYRA
jgi:hypothetical protein